MIPRVEEFRAKLRIPPFIDARALQDADVRVADGRPAANGSRRIAELREVWIRETVWVEEVICGDAVERLYLAPIKRLERPCAIRLPDGQEEKAAHKFLVVAV